MWVWMFGESMADLCVIRTNSSYRLLRTSWIGALEARFPGTEDGASVSYSSGIGN